MTDETRDPREAAANLMRRAAWMRNEDYQRSGFPFDLVQPLAAELEAAATLLGATHARLDAADPLRAMLGEVVEAIRYALPSLEHDTDRLLEDDYYGAGMKALAKLDEIRLLLARLRTLTPTEGGTDDGE